MRLELRRGGLRYDLTDCAERILEGLDGMGLPPVAHTLEHAPYQTGATLTFSRLEPRTIPIVVRMKAGDETEHWETREELAEFLAPYGPLASPLRLRLYRPLDRILQLDVVYNGELTYSREGQREWYQLAAFLLLAPQPIWYDPRTVSSTIQFTGGGDPFVVPMTVPHAVGADRLDETRTLTYSGSWPTQPILRLHGPITNPIIDQETTGQMLDFTNTPDFVISLGEWVEIDLRDSYGIVTDQDGNSMIQYVSEDSDLATFRMATRWEVPGGANQIRFRGEAIDGANTRIDVSWLNRYSGV